jgi:hypothetical protein
MNLVSLAIWINVIVAVAAIVVWFLNRSGLVIPEPLKIALLAIVAIIAILIVAGLVGPGPVILR